MVDQYTKNRKTFVMLFVTTMVVSFGLISFLNFSDTEVRERDYFYSPAFYYFAIYIGIGAASLLNEFRNLFERRKANPAPALYGFAVVLLILPFFTLKNHYHTHDRSQNYTCAEYARNALVGLEKDAIIFTNGDNDTFPLWYIQEVEKFRTDVKVVNMSLLQTPWYIIQCRDNEPKAPISWTDEQIYRLTPVPTKDGWLRVSDVAMQHILRTNNWERPIYVSTTVPRTTYAPYLDILELEGLVFRFVPRKGENMVNEELLKKNVTERYDFSSILDEHGKRRYEVYLPAHTQNLITHYSYSYMRLAVIQHRDSLFDDAVTSLERAREISPILPEPAQLLGWYYLDAGDTLKAVGFYNDELRQQPGNVDLRFRLAGVYERIGDDPNALEQLEMIIQIEPNNRDAVMAATGIAFRNGQTAKARGIVTSWLRIRPDDAGARSVLQEIDGKLQEGASPQ
jgi:tetratricopeptide (TPR) repeat protein